MKVSLRSISGLLSVCLVAVACKEAGTDPTPPPPSVASVTLSEASATLEIGGSVTFTATARDAAGTALAGRTISWSSSAPAIATVSNGLVTAVGAGFATITATSEGRTGSAEITVNAPPPPSCDASTPTGRLSLLAAQPRTYRYQSQGGWRVDIREDWIVRIVHEDSGEDLEIWGTPLSPTDWTLHNESLSGKHIGMRAEEETFRTVLLPDGTLITVQTSRANQRGRVSIYAADQTHRVEVRDFQVVRSCLIGNFGEAEEPDGYATRLVFEPDAMLWESTYFEGTSATGTPLPRVPNSFPYGRAFLNSNAVDDYYDDPELGHT